MPRQALSGARSPASPRGRTTRRRRRCPRSSSSSPKVSRCPDVRRDIAAATRARRLSCKHAGRRHCVWTAQSATQMPCTWPCWSKFAGSFDLSSSTGPTCGAIRFRPPPGAASDRAPFAHGARYEGRLRPPSATPCLRQCSRWRRLQARVTGRAHFHAHPSCCPYLGLAFSANANASSLATSTTSVSPKRPKRPALV
jgi:hypothetical protein